MVQSHYVAQLLGKHRMLDAKLIATLLERGVMDILAEAKTEVSPLDGTCYTEAIGSILWLASMTKLDLAFAAAFLAQFSTAPTT